MSSVPTLSGPDVLLRGHRISDAGRVVEACADERTSYWLGTLPTPYTEEDANTYLESTVEQVALGDALHWAVAEAGTDLLVGAISLLDLKSASGPEVGYWTHPQARGRGVMTQALSLVIKHAFAPTSETGLGLGKLRLESAVENSASRRVAEQCGFTEVNRVPAAITCRDGLHEGVRYELLITGTGPRT